MIPSPLQHQVINGMIPKEIVINSPQINMGQNNIFSQNLNANNFPTNSLNPGLSNFGYNFPGQTNIPSNSQVFQNNPEFHKPYFQDPLRNINNLLIHATNIPPNNYNNINNPITQMNKFPHETRLASPIISSPFTFANNLHRNYPSPTTTFPQ